MEPYYLQPTLFQIAREAREKIIEHYFNIRNNFLYVVLVISNMEIVFGRLIDYFEF